MPRVERPSVFVTYSHFGVISENSERKQLLLLVVYIASLYVPESIMPNTVFS
jgi:hypothetical protein